MPLISAHIEKMYAIHYHLYSGEPFNDHVVSERALVAKTGVQQYVRKVSGSVGMAVLSHWFITSSAGVRFSIL